MSTSDQSSAASESLAVNFYLLLNISVSGVDFVFLTIFLIQVTEHVQYAS